MASTRDRETPPVKRRSRSLSQEEIAQRKRREERNRQKELMHKKKRRRRKAIILALEAVVLVFLGAVIFLYSKWDNIVRADFSDSDVRVNEDLSENTLQSLSGYRTIAVFGTDARDMTTETGHADVVMLVSINNETGDIKLASVFRDLFVNDPYETDTYRKMTTMY